MSELTEVGGLAEPIRRAAPGLFLALLVLILFADVLFLPGDKVPSAPYGDVNHYFSTARAFGFREISRGNLPLWDPYIFSGTPFVATFQSALLYPPNLIYAVLPLSKAISFDLAVHVLLFGLFTFAWARSRSVGPVGAAFAGAVAMFSGAYFYRVAAGHVTVIDGFAWMPLILLAVDKLLERPSLFWTMAGIFAVSMQILAGMPQVVFITFVTAGLLCVFQPMRWIKKPAALAGLASLGIFPVLLAAVQLFTSFQAMQYSKSHGGKGLARLGWAVAVAGAGFALAHQQIPLLKHRDVGPLNRHDQSLADGQLEKRCKSRSDCSTDEQQEGGGE